MLRQIWWQTYYWVEDDDDLAELVQMHLKFQGHHVERANTIEKAQGLYLDGQFDLVVLDRGLPFDGDGLDFCRMIRHRKIDSRVDAHSKRRWTG